MSDRLCNLCLYQNIVTRARRSKKTVTLMPATLSVGVNVFVHPVDVDITQLEGIETPGSENRVLYFAAWFMEIPEECAC